MTPELAELVGYFMGDGSLHARGLRFCVAEADFDVVERLEQLGKEVFGLGRHGHSEAGLHRGRVLLGAPRAVVGGVRLRQAPPERGPHRQGLQRPHPRRRPPQQRPARSTGAFLRGLFEADGTVTAGVPDLLDAPSLELRSDVQSLLLALGYPTTRKLETTRTGWGQAPIAVLRLLNAAYAGRWAAEIGFIGDRKNAAVAAGDATPGRPPRLRPAHPGAGRPAGSRPTTGCRKVLLMELSPGAGSPAGSPPSCSSAPATPSSATCSSFFYDRVTSAELGDEELTYDLSVPDNVTYVANGFVSHNTIGLMMDCDTTGIEPDLGPVQDQEAGRRRHDVDRQPDGAPGPAPARATRPGRSTRSSPTSTSTRPSWAPRTSPPSTSPCSPAPWATTSSTTWATCA